MSSPRLLVSSLAVLLIAGLIGCGGGTPPSFGDDPTTSTTSGDTSSGNTGSTDLRAPAGSYGASVSGNDGTTTFTGTGTGTAASDGTISLSLAAADTSDATARSITAVVGTNGGVTSGSVTVGTNAAAALTAGTLAKQSNGKYLLTVSFVNAAARTETDVYTLTGLTVVYQGPVTGTDNQGATYSGTGTGSVSSGNVLSLSYLSRRSIGGTVQTHTLSTTLISGGTLSGTLDLGGGRTTPTTGTWIAGTDTSGIPTLTINLSYVNPIYISGSTGLSPTTAEKLVLTKQ